MSRGNFFSNMLPTWARRGETPSTPNPALERARIEAIREIQPRRGYVAPPVDNGHWYIDTASFHQASLDLDRPSISENRDSMQERIIRNLNDEIRHYRTQFDAMNRTNRELQHEISNLKHSHKGEVAELNERIEYLEFLVKEESGAEND